MPDFVALPIDVDGGKPDGVYLPTSIPLTREAVSRGRGGLTEVFSGDRWIATREQYADAKARMEALTTVVELTINYGDGVTGGVLVTAAYVPDLEEAVVDGRGGRCRAYLQDGWYDLAGDFVAAQDMLTTLGRGDHGSLAGLADDDHPQYLLVNGLRAMSGDLDMGAKAITNVGNVDGRDVSADGTKLDGIEANATADQTDAEIEAAYNTQVAQVSAGEKTAGTATAIRRFAPKDIADMAGTHGGGGGGDHGGLTGLGDDDHTQYHNDARGDARYYTQTQVDTSLSGKSDVGHTHTLSDVTDSGALAALNTVGTSQVDDEAITNAKLAHVATDTIKGRTTAGTGDVEDMTPAQVRTMLNVEDGAEVNDVDSVNTQTGAVVLDADDISDAATTNKFTTSAEISKLSGIEANATANPRSAMSIFEATLSSATQNCNGTLGSTLDFTWTTSVNNLTYIDTFTNGDSIISFVEAGEYVIDVAIIVLNSALSGRLIWTGQVRHENSSAVEQYTHTLAASYIRDQSSNYDSGGVGGQVTVFAAAGDQLKIRRVVLDTANSASNCYADQTETKVRIQKID